MNRSPGNDRDLVALSGAGAARRDAMLGELLGELGRVRRRRARRRALGGAGALALAILAVAIPASVHRPREATDARPGAHVRAEPPVPTGTTTVIVATDPAILDRYGLPFAPAPETMLPDDAALLAELAAIARPAGIIRTGGRVRVTGGVVDQL